MTLHRSLNQAQFGGNYFTWELKETCKAAGWTITRSGSGTGGVFDTSEVFDTGGKNPVTGSGAVDVGPIGSAHWGRQWAWFVMQDPDGNREWLFQRIGNNLDDNEDNEWTVVYSPAAGFTGGDPTTRATATDEHQIHSSTSIFQEGWRQTLAHFVADDTAIAGEYGFFGLQLIGTNAFSAWCAQDVLVDNEGSPTNPHPLMLHATDLPLTRSNHGIRPSGADMLRGWALLEAGLAGEQWGNVILPYVQARTSGPVVYPGGAGTSPWDGKERPMVIPVHAVPLAKGGYLGTSTWLRWKGVATRNYPDQATTPDPFVYMNDMLVNGWDPAITPASIP